MHKKQFLKLCRHTKLYEIWNFRGNKTLTSYPIQVEEKVWATVVKMFKIKYTKLCRHTKLDLIFIFRGIKNLANIPIRVKGKNEMLSKYLKWDMWICAAIQNKLQISLWGLLNALHLTLYKWGEKIWTTDVKVPKSKYANLCRHTKIYEIWKNRGNKTLTSSLIQVEENILSRSCENSQNRFCKIVQAYENKKFLQKKLFKTQIFFLYKCKDAERPAIKSQ